MVCAILSTYFRTTGTKMATLSFSTGLDRTKLWRWAAIVTPRFEVQWSRLWVTLCILACRQILFHLRLQAGSSGNKYYDRIT